MRTVILCPRRAGFAERDRAWAFLEPWWADHLPEFELHVGDHDAGPFNRAAAINRAAVGAGDWDVAVVIDADVLMDPRQVRAAVAVAAHTGGPALAYSERLHLSQHGTSKVLGGYAGNWQPFVKSRYTDSCSSAFAVRRDLFDRTGGFDELFVGWGWEDVAFRCATEVLGGEQLVQISGPIWHLWHIVSSGNNPHEPTFQANRARGELYRQARYAWDVAAMEALVTEHIELRTVPA